MVDVVWAVSMAVCAVVILNVILYFRKKNQAELVAEEEQRMRKHAVAVAAAVGGAVGRQLQLSSEEIQQDLDRLCLLFGHSTEPARKREAPKPPPEAPKPPPAAPKEEVPKPPAEITEKPAEARNRPTRPLKTECKARAEDPKGSEHIQSEIEQAVKETQ
ncbi:hypothetical protein SKAU_G00289420 [Synaphobranchus kaupii]|uniref:Uncharacterized protein n=1 Tax=Synaphobranchus kaupii TaxID=118154 RepID=A0A9Q1ETM2_SYNKA|nr:hypothetical protein SKAU_G00289420 [Synaphobranchus kaupii]